MSKDDPAFPVPPFTAPSGDFVWPYNGLTKREYLAATAMQGIMADPNVRLANPDHFKEVAELSVKLADALIAELNK